MTSRHRCAECGAPIIGGVVGLVVHYEDRHPRGDRPPRRRGHLYLLHGDGDRS